MSAGDLDLLMTVNPGQFKPSGSGKSKVSEPGKSKGSASENLRPCDNENQQIELYIPSMAVDNQVGAHNTSTENTPCITLGCSTPAQVEMQIAQLGHPPGTHAAAILLHAQRQQDRRIMDEVVGVVALLGAVENEQINRSTALTPTIKFMLPRCFAGLYFKFINARLRNLSYTNNFKHSILHG